MSEKRECPGCLVQVLVNKSGELRKHPDCNGALSDPAPTVEPMDDMQDNAPLPSIKGPWFGAMYTGECSVCDGAIYEGERIRSDGQGGYECEDCGEFEDRTGDRVHPGLKVPSSYQEQASAAAKRYVQAQAPVIVGIDPAGPAIVILPAPESFTFEDPTEVQDPASRLNVSGQPPARRDHMKRYLVVDPDLGDFRRTKSKERKPQGITRATTFNKAASDSKAINDWGKRNIVIGAARRRDVLLRAHGLTHENGRDALEAIVKELEAAAGAKVGSDLGTYLHEFTELMDASLKGPDDAPEEFRRSLWLYEQALQDAGLEPVPELIERTTFIREFGGVCGTFDRIFYHRPSGTYMIGDLKTGKTMKYAMDETNTQMWTYAHGVNQNGVYDWNTDTWGPAWDVGGSGVATSALKVREDVGVIIHMPVQGPDEGTVSLVHADLVAGAKHAELCYAIRSRDKAKVAAFEVPAVYPEGQAGSEDISEALARREPLSWETRFLRVASGEEATALWRLAKAEGITGVRLNDLIEIARAALRDKG